MKRLRRRFLDAILLCGMGVSAYSATEISGDFTLTGNQTFTGSGETYDIGSSSSDNFSLGSYTATFTGNQDFEVESHITGTGNVLINLTDDTKTVTYRNSNSYTGTTEVLSGILFLDSPSGANNGILGDLIIGGGSNQAMVTRDDKQNKELISDTATVTLRANGVLELNRAATGGSGSHDSIETFGALIMDGGTLVNVSPNDNPTTITIGTLILLSDSTLDLGTATSLTIGDVDLENWNTNAQLFIDNWETADTVIFGEMTPEQQAQIYFETSTGYVVAAQIVNGVVVPSSTVPEISGVWALPALGGFIFYYERKRRRNSSVAAA